MESINIPDEAAPVVEVLRRDVPKPEVLPALNPRSGYTFLRFPQRRGGTFGSCPMGLHPLALADAPGSTGTFPVSGVSDGAIGAFSTWWDHQTDARGAVDAVWGE